MTRLFVLLLAFSQAVLTSAYRERVDGEETRLMELLQRALDDLAADEDLGSTLNIEETEVNVTGWRAYQSSFLGKTRVGFSFRYNAPKKAVDGRIHDSSFLGENGEAFEGSCTATAAEDNPYWVLHLDQPRCVSRVSILNRGDGNSERLIGAIVKVGNTKIYQRNKNSLCGSPVTVEQAAVSGGWVDFVCRPQLPALSKIVLVAIPAADAILQLCEVRIWELPPEQCVKDASLGCEPNPCVNAECVPQPDGQAFCKCHDGQNGEFCEAASLVVECDPSLDEDRYIYDRYEGYIQSPGYPAPYSKHRRCPYIIGSPVADRIQFRFDDIDMDFGTNYLSYRIGGEFGFRTGEYVKIEGALKRSQVINSNKVSFHFQTNYANLDNQRGFRIHFRILKKGEEELDVTEQTASQSTFLDVYPFADAAKKAIDGRFNNTRLLAENGEMYGGSCTTTQAQENPLWELHLNKDYCVSRVSILNRGDGESERLTGAVVTVGMAATASLDTNPACGSPVTAQQAAVSGGTVVFVCDEPILARFVAISIPSSSATLQLCEVRVWQVPMEQCLRHKNECESDPCQNGAECVDGMDEFSCTCAAGYTGPLCETDIDECGSDPCQNGAECVDDVNEFSCTCAVGYSGSFCETNIGECNSSPCQSGDCRDDANGFSCECSPGYEGTLCETNIDECSSDPCQNDAECVDNVNEFSCTCAAGYTGKLCETAIPKPVEPDKQENSGCTTNPCRNGVCVNYGSASFKCVCSQGYEGTSCEIDIDECGSNPCQNGAECVDGVSEVACRCASGFTGRLCEIAVQVESQTFLQVNLVTEYCIKKVVVRKRGDCTGGRLAGAVVRTGTSSSGLTNGICGSALTAQQAEVRRSSVDFLCDPPLTAKFVTLDIPLLRVPEQPMCEVTVEQGTPGPCYE